MIQDIYTGKLEVGYFSVITIRIYRTDSLFVWVMCHLDLLGGCQEIYSGTKKGLMNRLNEEFSNLRSRIESGSITMAELHQYSNSLKALGEARKALQIYPYENNPTCDLWV